MSASELLLTMIVALIAFGPSKLPMLAKHLAKLFFYLTQAKTQASLFWQSQLKELQLIENNQKAEIADSLYKQKEENFLPLVEPEEKEKP